jgi:hypothetical protein
VTEDLTFAGTLSQDAGTTLTIQSSAVTLNGTVQGEGQVIIGAKATLVVGGDASKTETVVFSAPTGRLDLTKSAGFAAGISGFGAGDQIDLTNPAFAYGSGETLAFKENAAGTAGTLTISDGASKIAITLFGQYAAAGFTLASDGNGGSVVTYAPPTPKAVALATPHH